MRKFSFHPCGNYREKLHAGIEYIRNGLRQGLSRNISSLAIFYRAVCCQPLHALYSEYNRHRGYCRHRAQYPYCYTGQNFSRTWRVFGVGAYAAAIMATRLEWIHIAIPAAGIITALVGMIIGVTVRTLERSLFDHSTLAGQFIIEYVLIQWDSLTKGTMGITLPVPQIMQWQIAGDKSFFFLIFASLVLMTWFAVNIMRSKYGRAFIAIRDNDRAAEGMGIPIFKIQTAVLRHQFFYAGFAGALWAY